MTQEKKPVGRPKERPDGELSLKIRLPLNLYRVLKGVSGLRGLSMNDAATEAVALWAAQYPSLVAAVDSIPEPTPKAQPKATSNKTDTKKASNNKPAPKTR